MAKNLRVHELAKELGLTNTEAVDLCAVLGIPVKSHSSSLNEAYSDMVRRRAHRDGLVRDEQPPEPDKPETAKKAAARKAAASAAEIVAPPPVVETPIADVPVAVVEPAVVPEPVPVVVVTEPVAQPVAQPVAEPVAPVAPSSTPAPVVQAPVVRVPVAEAPAVVEALVAEASTPSVEVAAAVSEPKATISSPGRITSSRPETGVPRPAIARREVPAARPTQRPMVDSPSQPPGPPKSLGGRPIPPPPGRPVSATTGRPIPPPPGSARPGSRPGGAPSGPGGGAGGRTGGYQGRPGGGPGGAARPGYGGGPGGPGGGGPGGPGAGGPGRPGANGRPSGQRRPPNRSKRRRRRDRDELQPQEQNYTSRDAPVPTGTVVVERGVSAQEFGPKMNRTAADVVKFLLQHGEFLTATVGLSDDHMELFALELGVDLLLVDPGQEQEVELQAMFDDSDDDDEELLQPRPPVITVMGHVDHGKTTVLDKIRSANVVAGEAGGITQHIGAYQVDKGGRKITFIDTPGHAAFTQMRARGAQATDIVVLVVAADDGVMPQTIEAINHARAADVPIVVAVNKVDKDNADPQRVLTQLAEHQLVPESWGGDTIVVEMSATQNLGIDDLLEQLLVVAELEDLQANPTGRAKGVVLEANLDKGRGPVATILVDKGELKIGDPIVAGAAWGRVRAMLNDKGEQVKVAGPSMPVEVLGLSSVPDAGDEFRAAPDEKTARTVGEARGHHRKVRDQRGDARVKSAVRLEDIFDQIQSGETATLNLILKADVQGSLEAVTDSLKRLQRPEVDITFVHRAVGGITENDISLAETTGATILGFNVRADRKTRDVAQQQDVEIREYEIIYKLLEDIEQAMIGMLAPIYEEVVTGDAEVREIFRVPKLGAIAGCLVQNGAITRGSKVRFLRQGTIIWKGSITSLRRFKDDAAEVRAGFECGIGLSDFQDLKPGDIIETFDEREIARSLS